MPDDIKLCLTFWDHQATDLRYHNFFFIPELVRKLSLMSQSKVYLTRNIQGRYWLVHSEGSLSVSLLDSCLKTKKCIAHVCKKKTKKNISVLRIKPGLNQPLFLDNFEYSHTTAMPLQP